MYKIVFDESVLLFFKENDISLTRIFNKLSKTICIFPRSQPIYSDDVLFRVALISNLKFLYYINRFEKTLYILDCVYVHSNVKLKVRN